MRLKLKIFNFMKDRYKGWRERLEYESKTIELKKYTGPTQITVIVVVVIIIVPGWRYLFGYNRLSHLIFHNPFYSLTTVGVTITHDKLPITKLSLSELLTN
jgi:hypothetical protein